MFKLSLIVALFAVALAEPVPGPATRCDLKHPLAGLSNRYWESIAHAIHSLDVLNLQKFAKNVKVRYSHSQTVSNGAFFRSTTTSRP